MDVKMHATEIERELRAAAERGSVQGVKMFCEKPGVDINARAWLIGPTALELAVNNEHEEVVNHLIRQEGIKVSDDIAIRAVENNWISASLYIYLMKKVDINYTDSLGRTPLMLAAINGNTTIVEFLAKQTSASDDLQKLAHPLVHLKAVSNNNLTALAYAIEHGNMDTARYLRKRELLQDLAKYALGLKYVEKAPGTQLSSKESIVKAKYDGALKLISVLKNDDNPVAELQRFLQETPNLSEMRQRRTFGFGKSAFEQLLKQVTESHALTLPPIARAPVTAPAVATVFADTSMPGTGIELRTTPRQMAYSTPTSRDNA